MKILQNLTVILIQLGKIYRKFAAKSIQLISYVTSIKYFVAMKRYLISGVVLLITGLVATSCHDKEIDYVYGADQKVNSYNEAFKAAFGTPQANHHWGFVSKEAATRMAMSSKALTRTANKESNQWVSQGWKVPDPLTPAQKDKVRRYFQQNQNPKGISVNYENFFVQQVYKGGTNTSEANTTETYLRGNLTTVTGSDHMDKLTAGSIEDHINDYNNSFRGDINVQNNSQNGEHQDAITLMENSKTDCFGYHNSDDSRQYNDKYVIIPGSTIDAWDSSEPSVTGMFFVGFDYEANKAAYDHNGTLSVNGNMYLVKETTADDPKGVILPNVNNGKKYLIGGADGYYSDWIVRITKGVKTTDKTVDQGDKRNDDSGLDQFWRKTTWTPIETGRVFCEDLGGSYSTNRDDFDFNDIVFDAIIWQTEDFFYQEVKVQEVWEEGTPLAGQLKFEQATDANGDPLFEPMKDENDNIIYQTTTVTENVQVQRLDAEGKPVLDENNQPIYDTQTVTHEVTTDVPVYDESKPIYDEEKPVWKMENGEFVHEPKELTNYHNNPKYVAEIALLATGATIAATVEDTEVHDAFNAGVTTMINTVGSSSTAFGSYNDHDPVYLGKYDIETPSINDIPVTVLWGTAHESGASTLQSGNEYDGCPQKFKVPIGTPWVQERFGMIMGYPAFADWVQEESAEWLNPSEESKQRQPLYLYEQSWPNVLDATAYEERETITEAQLGEPGARTKSNGSQKPSNPDNLTTKWSSTSYTYQAPITPSELSDAGLVGTKGASVVLTGTYAHYCWGATLLWGDWTSSFFSADQDSQYGQGFDRSKDSGPIVVTIPVSSEEMAKIMQVGLRVQFDNITLSKIEIKQ